MQELHDSDYTLMTTPGTSNWDAFKYGNKLWQKIFKSKMEPFEEEFRLQDIENNEDSIKWRATQARPQQFLHDTKHEAQKKH